MTNLTSGPQPGSPARGSVKWHFPAIHPEGRRFGAISAAIAAVLALLHWPILAWLMVGVTIWVFAFFRDPVRAVPQDENVILAPADGLVTLIQTVPPPPELAGPGGLGDAPMTRVSIFMSVFDVHINRTPIGGTILDVVYISGKFINADLDKASEDNERNGIVIEAANGSYGIVQIAGLVARRIVCFVASGDRVGVGDRIGLIRFGSRVDVYLPEGARPLVGPGAHAIAGETVIADFRTEKAPRSFKLS